MKQDYLRDLYKVQHFILNFYLKCERSWFLKEIINGVLSPFNFMGLTFIPYNCGLYQIEPLIFLILSFWAFFRKSVFLYFKFYQGLWILSCEEINQIAFGMSMVLFRCPYVPEIMHGVTRDVNKAGKNAI
jgi:hypothetical protein